MEKSDSLSSERPETKSNGPVGPASPSQLGDAEFNHMLPISQFAHSTGISRSALIYYDETGVLHPAERNAKNNYRYYHPEQIITANLINVLAELDIPLKQIKELSSKRSAASMLELFDEHRDTLQKHIDQLQQSMKLVNVFHDLLSMGKVAYETPVIIKTIPRWSIVIGPRNTFSLAKDFYQPFLKFCAWAQERNYPVHFPIGGHFSDFESFCDHPGEPDNFFLLLDTNSDSSDTLEVLTAYSRGFYGRVGNITERMKRALNARQLEPDGPLLCTYIEDEISIVDSSQYLMMATMQVKHRDQTH